MNKTVAYVRVSSSEQGKSGIGLKVQVAQIKAYAEAKGYIIERIYEEVASAIGGNTLEQRPQLRAALRKAKRLGCPLMIATLDRLARNAAEIETLLMSSGVEIVSIQHSPDAISLVRSRAAGIQKKTELLKGRLSEGVRRAKAKGVIFGNPVNLAEAQKKGAKANSNAALSRLKALAPIVAEIRAGGAQSGVEITKRLNKLGHRTSRGLDWDEQNLRRVLRQIDRANADRARSDALNKENPDWGSF